MTFMTVLRRKILVPFKRVVIENDSQTNSRPENKLNYDDSIAQHDTEIDPLLHIPFDTPVTLS